MKSGVLTRKPYLMCAIIEEFILQDIEEADQQEIFQAVSWAAYDVINDRWLATQQA